MTLVPEMATDAAEKADEMQARKETLGPLHGLPVAHQDLLETRGIRTAFGSPLYKDYITSEDDIVVDRMRRAGAITIGKTNTPEFGAGSQTFNKVFGATHNPYDLTLLSMIDSTWAILPIPKRALALAFIPAFTSAGRLSAGTCSGVKRVAAGKRPTDTKPCRFCYYATVFSGSQGGYSLYTTIRWSQIQRVLFFGLMVSALAATLAGCAKQEAARPPRMAVPVVVGNVSRKAVPINLSAIGNVEAYTTVSIKAQVSGELLEVHFKEGDMVHKGQLLLTIDPRPYQAVLAQAQASLERDKAIAVNGRAQAQRYQKLLEAGISPSQEAESYISAANAADAVVAADEAAIQTAQLNLEFCQIYSPVDGQTGYLMLKPGNLVKVADVPIVVINQVSPIFVNFGIPTQFLPDVRKFMSQGTIGVDAILPNDSGPVERGTLTFIDNNVDLTTGTIHLRGEFANPHNRLWPGLFVNVLLTLSKEANAIVVPSHAVVPGQKGPLVYVVKSDNTVEARPVVSNRSVEGVAVIDKGLELGETIVVDGQAGLAPGMRVEIKNPGDRGKTAESNPT